MFPLPHLLTCLRKCLITFLGQVVDPVINNRDLSVGLSVYFQCPDLPAEKLIRRGHSASWQPWCCSPHPWGGIRGSKGSPGHRNGGACRARQLGPSRSLAELTMPGPPLFGCFGGTPCWVLRRVSRLSRWRPDPGSGPRCCPWQTGQCGMRFVLPSLQQVADTGMLRLSIWTTLFMSVKFLVHWFSSRCSPAESCQMCFKDFILVMFGVLSKKLLKCLGLPNFFFFVCIKNII